MAAALVAAATARAAIDTVLIGQGNLQLFARPTVILEKNGGRSRTSHSLNKSPPTFHSVNSPASSTATGRGHSCGAAT